MLRIEARDCVLHESPHATIVHEGPENLQRVSGCAIEGKIAVLKLIYIQVDGLVFERRRVVCSHDDCPLAKKRRTALTVGFAKV